MECVWDVVFFLVVIDFGWYMWQPQEKKIWDAYTTTKKNSTQNILYLYDAFGTRKMFYSFFICSIEDSSILLILLPLI